MLDHKGAVVAGRKEGYYRRKAAGWLTAAASFRQCAAAGGRNGISAFHALQMARDSVAMAAANRAAVRA